MFTMIEKRQTTRSVLPQLPIDHSTAVAISTISTRPLPPLPLRAALHLPHPSLNLNPNHALHPHPPRRLHHHLQKKQAPALFPPQPRHPLQLTRPLPHHPPPPHGKNSSSNR